MLALPTRTPLDAQNPSVRASMVLLTLHNEAHLRNVLNTKPGLTDLTHHLTHHQHKNSMTSAHDKSEFLAERRRLICHQSCWSSCQKMSTASWSRSKHSTQSNRTDAWRHEHKFKGGVTARVLSALHIRCEVLCTVVLGTSARSTARDLAFHLEC